MVGDVVSVFRLRGIFGGRLGVVMIVQSTGFH